MSLQNRVDPADKVLPTAAREAIHKSDREITRFFKSRRWITCVLEFRGRTES
jgi:hypothetical protein